MLAVNKNAFTKDVKKASRRLNYYNVLKISKNVSTEEIKKAYRQLALQYHPDKGGKIEDFKQLTLAHETLSDPLKRRNYDAIGGLPASAVGFASLLAPKEVLLSRARDELSHANLLNQKNLNALMKHKEYAHDFWLLFYILNDAGIMNQENIDAAMHIMNQENIDAPMNNNISYVHSLQSICRDLNHAELLNQKNFDFLIKHQVYIRGEINELAKANILNQEMFDAMIMFKIKNPHYLGLPCKLQLLDEAGILNQHFVTMLLSKDTPVLSRHELKANIWGLFFNETTWIFMDKIPTPNIYFALYFASIFQRISPSWAKQVLLWQGPEELQLLNQCIDKLIAHGLSIISSYKPLNLFDPVSGHAIKGLNAITFGIRLKCALKQFFEKSPQEQQLDKDNFKKYFLTMLQTYDGGAYIDDMKSHRDCPFWKILIANIIIAFTGLGLFAIGLNYLINGQCFFAKTQWQHHVDAIENAVSRVF